MGSTALVAVQVLHILVYPCSCYCVCARNVFSAAFLLFEPFVVPAYGVYRGRFYPQVKARMDILADFLR